MRVLEVFLSDQEDSINEGLEERVELIVKNALPIDASVELLVMQHSERMRIVDVGHVEGQPRYSLHLQIAETHFLHRQVGH